MESKEYYQSIMSVIEYLIDGHKDITYEKATDLSGEYWPRIYDLLCGNHIGVGISGGCFHVTNPQYLNPIHADCMHALDEIAKQEADRELANKAHETDIRYARKAYWVSWVAIAVAVLSLAWQIIKEI